MLFAFSGKRRKFRELSAPQKKIHNVIVCFTKNSVSGDAEATRA
jgi:hypothetical protein